jgi:hypothetical protein
MKKILYIILFLGILPIAFSQGLKLKNALVIGQFDKPEDRYAMEVNVTEILNNVGIKALPSLNILKQGNPASNLVLDSIRNIIKNKGYDTYVIVNVRGYDRKFKPSESKVNFDEMLNRASLYHIYRDEATSVSFEFTFFRNNEVVFRDVLRCGNISNRDTVIKKFRKKLPKLIDKNWKN